MRTALGLCLLFCSLSAFGWGADGHQLVCRLAFDQLTDDGRKFVENTLELGVHLDGSTDNSFPEACLWPDSARSGNYRGTYEQHYMHVPRVANRPDFLRDCPALDCIAVGIQRSLTYLASPANGEREEARKAAALRFLGHFVGDLYQPLHVGHQEDQGGLAISVRWFGDETSLYEVWDDRIMERAGLAFPESLEVIAAVEVTEQPEDVLLALHQSFRLARSHAYSNVNGRPIGNGGTLGEAYFERSKPVVIEQLAKSAAHLAGIINRLAAGTQDTNILVE